jgi:phosphohistidine phosphatase
MKLYLMQHGVAVAKEQDPDRPLSEQGGRDVMAMADFLRGAGVKPKRVVHSGKLRARQSAEIAAAQLETDELTVMKGILPNDPAMAFADLTAEWTRDTLVVGHLPFLAKAACLMLTGDEGHAAIRFTPGTVVCLEREPGEPWELGWMVRPEALPH